MKNAAIALTAMLMVLLYPGCSSTQLQKEREALRGDPAWPEVRAYAQNEIKKREGSVGWRLALSAEESDALVPTKHEDGLWTLVAAADYPANTYGEVVDIVIREDGSIVFYHNRMDEDMRRSNKAVEDNADQPPPASQHNARRASP